MQLLLFWYICIVKFNQVLIHYILTKYVRYEVIVAYKHIVQRLPVSLDDGD